MAEKRTAVVVIDSSWVKQAGLRALFETEKEALHFYAVSVITFSLRDSWFIEIEFYSTNPALGKAKMKLFVPRPHVLSIVTGGDSKVRDFVGFKPTA